MTEKEATDAETLIYMNGRIAHWTDMGDVDMVLWWTERKWEFIAKHVAPAAEAMWDKFIVHYSKQEGHVDKDGKSTLKSFIGGIERYRKAFLEAQQ